MVWFSPIFSKNLTFSTSAPQTAIFGFLDSANNDSLYKNDKVLSNHILLIFKLYVYKSKEKKLVNINNLIAEIGKVKRIKKQIALISSKNTTAFKKKWHIINNIVENTCEKSFGKTGWVERVSVSFFFLGVACCLFCLFSWLFYFNVYFVSRFVFILFGRSIVWREQKLYIYIENKIKITN